MTAGSGGVDLLQIVMPGGIATAVLLIFNGVKTVREGRQKNEENVIKRWKDLYNERGKELSRLRIEADYQGKASEYYRNRARELEWLLHQHGIPVPPAPPPPTRRSSSEQAEQAGTYEG